MPWLNRYSLRLCTLSALFVALLLTSCGTSEPVILEGPVDCQPQNFVELAQDVDWTPNEISSICSLWIGNLPELAPDPSNQYGDDPAAAEFGQQLFFDARLSGGGGISCATCHDPAKNFTDGLETPIGGGSRKTPTIVGTAHSPWFFWDGHADSQWAQALGPLESAVEHNGTREQYAQLIADDPSYRATYESLFGDLPDVSTREGATDVFVNFAKAIAAYERLIMPGASSFDGYAQALLANDSRTMNRTLSDDEVAGLDLYINQGNCLDCHNGPLFTNNEFHGTAVVGMFDAGRAEGVELVDNNEFNCLSEHSDAEPEECIDLRFMRRTGSELEAAFKTPTLRNIADMPPYMHNGSFATLTDSLVHYNTGGFSSAFGSFGHNDLVPLNLTDQELGQLEAFMRSLSGGIDAPEALLSPPSP